MRNATKVLIVGAAALAACHAKTSDNAAANQELSIDGNLTSSQLPANTEIEMLPPDESSEASNGELATGQDNPDVNDLSNSD